MKLRLHDNTLRLRLNRAELSTFGSDGRIENSLVFGTDARFTYSLEIDKGSTCAHAVYEHAGIRVLVPEAIAEDWVRTDRVGIVGAPSSGPQILIEKDFQCLHRDGGDPDAYPNPLAPAED